MKHKAYVDITLKIEIEQGWDEKCTLTQVRKQAIDNAEQRLFRMVRESKVTGITMQGDPKVTFAFIELEKES